ncbi:hypothetical protein SRABI106_01926 [Rahnella aquatilis]|nr:hypothetical protein SRABI106_01926 [Rahnella aquatilis]
MGQIVVQRQLGQLAVRLCQRRCQNRGACLHPAIKDRNDQGDRQNRQRDHNHQQCQPVIVYAAERRHTVAVHRELCRSHANVMHTDNGSAHYHRSADAQQTDIG